MRTLVDRTMAAVIGALALVLVLAGVVDAGPLDPPGPPGSTRPLVEPRKPISSVPVTLSTPGPTT